MKKVIKLLGASLIAVGFLAACDTGVEDPNQPDGLDDPAIEDPALNDGIEDDNLEDDNLEDGGF